MKVRHGQRVRLNAPHHPRHGQVGTVRHIAPGSMDYNVKIYMDDGHGIWCPEEVLEAPTPGQES